MADTSQASGVEEDLSGGDADQASAPGNMPVGGGGVAGLSGSDIAVEAASYGPADGALAEEGSGEDERAPGRTGRDHSESPGGGGGTGSG